MDPWETHRTLGVHMSVEGKGVSRLSLLQKKSSLFASALRLLAMKSQSIQIGYRYHALPYPEYPCQVSMLIRE